MTMHSQLGAHAANLTPLFYVLNIGGSLMAKFILWLILLVLCWPLALLALLLYPVVWLLTLPFRLLGYTVEAVFRFLRGMLMLPARILEGPAKA